MILLKVNQVVTKKYIRISKVSFHYAILGMMLGWGLNSCNGTWIPYLCYYNSRK